MFLRNKHKYGFTIIELIIVIAIMGLMATILVANYNSTRSKRSLSISANELTTNTRKVQSYALSARDSAPGVPAKYYVVQYDFGSANQYQILTINENYAMQSMETVTLPQNITFDSSQGYLEHPTAGTRTVPTCLQILFALPYGRIYMIGSSSPCSSSALLTAVQNPITMSNYVNSRSVVALKDQRGGGVMKMQVNGLSGTITIQ